MCNEVFSMFVLYHFMCFTPWIAEPETKLLMGTSFCAFESANLIANLGYVFVIQFYEGLYKYRLWKFKKQRLEKVKGANHEQLKKSANNYANRRKKFKVPFSISNQAPELSSNLGNEQPEIEVVKQTNELIKKPKLKHLDKKTKLPQIDELLEDEELDLDQFDKHFDSDFIKPKISSYPQESLTYPTNIGKDDSQVYMKHLRELEEEEKKYNKGIHNEYNSNSRNKKATSKKP